MPVWLLGGRAWSRPWPARIVAPLATRLRGLYLAIVTLGLVFIGEHIFSEWSDLTGGVGVGRPAADPVLFGYDFDQDRRLPHRASRSSTG